METNPSPPNKNQEGDRDQDTTAQRQLSGAGMGKADLSPAGTASLPGRQAFQAGTRQVPAGGSRVRPTGRTPETPAPAARHPDRGADVSAAGRDRGTQRHQKEESLRNI